MDIKKLQAVVIDALEDVKAQDIKLFDTTHLTSLFERIVIASGTSNRQTKALAASVRDKVKEAGGIVIGMEGGDTGEWVLVDLGDMLVHIMQAPIRAYYRLEEIWGDKEIKLGAAKRIANKPAAGEAGEPKKVSRHLASMQTPSEIPAIKEVKETKPRAKKADASADAPKRSRKKAEAQAVLETVAAKKPRARKVAEPESVEVVDDSASDTPVKKPRARKAGGDAPAVAVPAGKRIKVATSKVVETELKEIKAAKTRTRKAAEAAPAPRVMKRTVKAKPE